MTTAGYVYILVNSAMPGLIKIGRTLRDSTTRARELFTTGVPLPFDVAFELFSEDHDALESAVHTRLNDFRVRDSREFFRYPLKDAIQLLLSLNSKPTTPDSVFFAESILDRLAAKYPGWLDPSITEARLVQTSARVWLELTREKDIGKGYLKDILIHRSDLAFIQLHDAGPTFPPTTPVSINATRFVETLDPHDIICTTDLFRDEVARKVFEDYRATHPEVVGSSGL